MCGLQTSPVSWLGGELLEPRRNRGQRVGGLPAATNSAVATNENPPHSRAAATDFDRLPVHEVCGCCRGAEPAVGGDGRRREPPCWVDVV